MMPSRIRPVFAFLAMSLLAGIGLTAQDPAVDLKALYDNHQWFDLRDAIRHTQAPALYRGAVAAAFNDAKAAESFLRP